MKIIETLEDNFTPAQVLQIRKEEQQKGHRVNVQRLYSKRVRLEIIEPDRAIDITARVQRLK